MAKTEAAHIPMMAAVDNFFGSSVKGSIYLLLSERAFDTLKCKFSISKFRSALGTNAHYACSKHNSFQYGGDSFPHTEKGKKRDRGQLLVVNN